jgi:hypothetical protein
VARVEGRYLSADRRALLVAAVVVEFGRPLHPVVVISRRGGDTAVHLWPAAPAERTDAVKRLVAQVGAEIAAFGAGSVLATNVDLPG